MKRILSCKHKNKKVREFLKNCVFHSKRKHSSPKRSYKVDDELREFEQKLEELFGIGDKYQ